MAPKTTAADRRYTEALFRVFELTRQEQLHAEGVPDVKLPAIPLIKGRYAALTRAEREATHGPAVYAAALATWHEDKKRCPMSGRRVPCGCEEVV